MKKIATLIFVLALTFPSIASADAIDMNFTSTGKGSAVNIGGLGWVFAGELKWTLNGSLDILSFCVDLHNSLGDPQTAYAESIGNLTGATTDAGRKVAYLYNNYADSASKSDALAAATQVAIWQILGGSSFVLAGSSISGLGGLADTLVALAVANYATGNTTATLLNVDPLQTGRYKGQDQVTRSVPEPGTLLLLGAGFAALAARRGMRRAR